MGGDPAVDIVVDQNSAAVPDIPIRTLAALGCFCPAAQASAAADYHQLVMMCSRKAR